MRNVNRLEPLYKGLSELHKKYFPDWRLGQLIMNILPYLDIDPFYIEDDIVLNKIENVLKMIKGDKNIINNNTEFPNMSDK